MTGGATIEKNKGVLMYGIYWEVTNGWFVKSILGKISVASRDKSSKNIE